MAKAPPLSHAAWLPGWLIGWLPGWLGGCLGDCLADWLAGWLLGCWLAGYLVGRLAGCLAVSPQMLCPLSPLVLLPEISRIFCTKPAQQAAGEAGGLSFAFSQRAQRAKIFLFRPSLAIASEQIKTSFLNAF